MDFCYTIHRWLKLLDRIIEDLELRLSVLYFMKPGHFVHTDFIKKGLIIIG